MKRLIIVVDLGHFKAYRVVKDPVESTRIELSRSYDTLEAHSKLREKLSDEAGRFGLIGGKTGLKGYGEAHNIELEAKKKMIKQIAGDINGMIKRERCREWFLAAGKSINRQILEQLDPSVRERLRKNIVSDLTKTHKSELLQCFSIT